MSPAPPSPSDWEGQTVLDREGEKIGKIEEIFLVEETGRPEWGLVKLGRIKGHATLVPLTRAHPVDKGVEIPFEKDVVSDAPAIEPDEDPSEQQVNALYRHYGIELPSGDGNGNGAAASHESNGASPAGRDDGGGVRLRRVGRFVVRAATAICVTRRSPMSPSRSCRMPRRWPARRSSWPRPR